jgi:hypothetical protein
MEDFPIDAAPELPPIEFDLPLAAASDPAIPDAATFAAIERLERFLGAIQSARHA